MTVWHRLAQNLKRNHMPWLERVFAKQPLLPSLQNFTEVRRILVIRAHDTLGDFLLSTPVFRILQTHFPATEVSVLLHESFHEVAKNNPHIDQILVFPDPGKPGFMKKLFRLWQQLRRWDMAIVLNTVSHALTSDLLAYFTGARYILGSEHRIFPGSSRNFFYNLVAPYWEGEKSQSERNLDIIRYLGIETADLAEEMHLSDTERDEAKEKLENWGLRQDRPVIGLHIGASKLFNRWPIGRFGELAQALHDRYAAQILLFWGEGEEILGEQFCHYLQFEPIEIERATVREQAAFLAHCDAVVCNDADAMHIAAAVGVPLVAIFGPTDPNEWKPYGEKFIAVRSEKQKTDDITTDQVIAELLSLLGSKLYTQKIVAAAADSDSASAPAPGFDISDNMLDHYLEALGKLENAIGSSSKK